MPNTNASEITISDVKSFKSCRYLWDFNSTLRRNLTPLNRGVHFTFGDLFHQALNAYYAEGKRADTWFEAAAKGALEEIPTMHPQYATLLEQVAYAPSLLRLYMQYAQKHDNWEWVSGEKRYAIKLGDGTPGKYFTFKFDGLVLRDGKHWLLEFKTTAQLPTDASFLLIDDQAVAYQWAAEKALGFPVQGVIYSYIRKKAPAVPELLASGGLSKRANIVTTREVYGKAIFDNGLQPDDYMEHLKYIEGKQEDDFLRRFEVTANVAQREAAGEQLLRLVHEMSDDEVFVYPSPERMKCSVCDFRQPCLARQTGYDYEEVLRSNYELNKPRE